MADDPSVDNRPVSPLSLETEGVLSFMSLSKRSGMTGYRSGFIAGDKEIIDAMLKARANFGLALPEIIQKGSIVAWNDDEHVAERRKVFSHRLDMAVPVFQELGMIDERPAATFYIWAKVPEKFKGNDTKFALELAKLGVICSPSQWLSEGTKGYVRFALVPEDETMNEAFELLKNFLNKDAAKAKDDSSKEEINEEETVEEDVIEEDDVEDDVEDESEEESDEQS